MRQIFCPHCSGELLYTPDKDCLVCWLCKRETAIPKPHQKIPAYRCDEHSTTPDESWPQFAALLPFRFTAAQVTEKLQSRLAQPGIPRAASLDYPQAGYIPFFLFRIKAKAIYQTDPNYGVSLLRAPYLIRAVERLPNRFAGKLEWELEKLLPFHEAYLAGFTVDPPVKDLPEAYNQAVNLAKHDLDIAVQKEVSKKGRNLVCYEPEYTDTTFRLILLPIFAGYFMQDGSKHYYAINGFSGTMVGDFPAQARQRTPQQPLPTVLDSRSWIRKTGEGVLEIGGLIVGVILYLLMLIVKFIRLLFQFF